MAIGAAVGVAMFAYGVHQSNKQADAIKKQAENNRKIAYMNAELMELDAFRAEKAGYTQAARYQSVIDSTVATQKAVFASENVDVTSGTAAAIQSDTTTIGYLNGLDIITQAKNQALGLKMQAIATRRAGDLGVVQGAYSASAAQSAGFFNAVTAGISGYNSFRQPTRVQTVQAQPTVAAS